LWCFIGVWYGWKWDSDGEGEGEGENEGEGEGKVHLQPWLQPLASLFTDRPGPLRRTPDVVGPSWDPEQEL